jgi:predicted nucleic acid-binding protein
VTLVETLVDTSAWVEFFRGHEPWTAHIGELLDVDRVVLCGPIYTELLRGTGRDRARVLRALRGCRMLPQPAGLWGLAGNLGHSLRAKGVTAKTLDLLIAVYALTHQTSLLCRDSDFEHMRDAGVLLQLDLPESREPKS